VTVQLLSEILAKTKEYIEALGTKAQEQKYVIIPEVDSPISEGGIQTRRILEKLDALGAALNNQAGVLDELREKMIEILMRPLLDQEDTEELQGDELDIAAKEQDEVYIHHETLRAMQADRHDALTGEDNPLIKQDVANCLDAAKEGLGPNPEDFQKLLAVRNELKPDIELGSIRDTISELRSLAVMLRPQDDGTNARIHAERLIVDTELAKLQKTAIDQAKVNALLEAELGLYRSTMNSRIEYYKQLQAVSDKVAPWDPDKEGGTKEDKKKSPAERLIKWKAEEEKCVSKLSSFKSKARYLETLRQETSSSKDQPRICIICQESFELGALTVCGHTLCKECCNIWVGQHRNCPVCKRHLKKADLHQIT
jgi:E3 ubiquitin-protein ligase SHPRH